METGTANAEPHAPPAQPVRPVRGLACPRCGGAKWRTLHTRGAVGRVVRERKCRGCGLVIRTAERLEAVPAVVPDVEVGVYATSTAEPSLPGRAKP